MMGIGTYFRSISFLMGKFWLQLTKHILNCMSSEENNYRRTNRSYSLQLDKARGYHHLLQIFEYHRKMGVRIIGLPDGVSKVAGRLFLTFSLKCRIFTFAENECV